MAPLDFCLFHLIICWLMFVFCSIFWKDPALGLQSRLGGEAAKPQQPVPPESRESISGSQLQCSVFLRSRLSFLVFFIVLFEF